MPKYCLLILGPLAACGAPSDPKPPIGTETDTETETTTGTAVTPTGETGTKPTGDTGAPPEVDLGMWRATSPFPWEWENPTPHGRSILDIDGLGQDDVWLFGANGWVERFDGTAWTSHYLPDLPGDYPYQTISTAAVLGDGVVTFPSSAGATIVTPDEVRFDEASGGSVMWGSAPDDVWSVANNFQRGFHYDGKAWTQDETFPGYAPERGSLIYTDMDGSSGDWIIAVGWRGVIASYEAGTWSAIHPFDEDLSGVHATGPDTSNWIVGEDGLLVEFTAAGVVSSSHISDNHLLDIWGEGGQLWAVGAGGTVLHYDGSTWTSQDTGATVSLSAVWGSSVSDVWVGGYGGELLHWDGITWTRRNPDPKPNWEHIGITPDGELVAAGFLSLGIRDKGTWSEIEVPFDPPFWNGFQFLTPVLSVGATTRGTFVGGVDGQIAMWDGSLWTELDTPLRHDVHDLGSNSQDLLFAAFEGGVWSWDGKDWTEGVRGSLTFNQRFFDLWTTPTAPDVWAAGEYGVWHYDGATWTQPRTGRTNCVWASGPDDVWVGTDWGLYSFDGKEWSHVSDTDRMRTYRIWGDGTGNIWFSGSSDVHLWDGKSLSTTFYGDAPEITGIAGEAVWIAGRGGAVLRHDL